MSTMNSEVYAALIEAGATEDKAREAAKSVAQYDTDIARMKASLLLLKWMVGFNLAFSPAILWRIPRARLSGGRGRRLSARRRPKHVSNHQ